MKTEKEFLALLFAILIIVISISYLASESSTSDADVEQTEQNVKERQEIIPKSKIAPRVAEVQNS